MKSVFLPKDQNQNTVHAHGGHILKDNGRYYFIGENRTERNKVSCYVSDDLENWEFSNNILTLDAKTDKHYLKTDLALEVEGHNPSVGEGCNIERPKVVYNEKTKKYVMWMHWELPDNYKEARCAVAVCDTIDGDYTYLGSFNPQGFMSRDCTIFKDDDGKAYFISSSRDNLDLHIYLLTEDYLAIDHLVRVLWPGQEREAPTMFKHDGTYYLLTSACTGWAPNQSAYGCSKTIDGDWSMLKNIGDDTTYRSQPTCVLEVNNKYYYLGDRWGGGGEKYFDSSYVLLPLEIGADGSLTLNFCEDVFIS